MDLVIGASQTVKQVARHGVQVEASGSGRFAHLVDHSQLRFMLDETVLDTCIDLFEHQPELLDSQNPTLRIPAPLLWIEWLQPHRLDVEEKTQTGCLIRASEDGRCGRLDRFWNVPGTGVCAAQAYVTFDLDRVREATGPEEGAQPVTVSEKERHLAGLLAHCGVGLDPAWLEYRARLSGLNHDMRHFVSNSAQTTNAAYPIAPAFIRLLSLRDCLDQ
jgi:hypothetical protein